MFKSAASKIAHNTTVPALAGSKDRALQNLITAEKSVLLTMQKLGVDLTKASDALKIWGNGEGVDLGDVLTASTTLMLMFTESLNVYANYEATIRGHMKAIRTREEKLEELKQRRKALGSRADSADKKLAKMNPEHKQLQAQKELLMRLQEEMRNMDAEIMNQEANLLDFKRYSAKTFMGLKFGGLQELCEKGIIISNHGKFAIAEIPMDPTQPGFPRPMYTGNPRTEQIVGEAQRLIQTVAFSDVPSQSAMTARPTSMVGPPSSPHSATFQQTGASATPAPQAAQPIHGQSDAEFRKFSLGPEFNVDSINLPYLQSQSYTPQPGNTPGLPHPQQYPGYLPPGAQAPQTIPDEFGGYGAQGQYPPRSNSIGPGGPNYYGNAPGPAPLGPRFATVGSRPVYPGYLPEMGDRPPSLDVGPSQNSFSSSVAQALGSEYGGQGSQGSGPSSDTRPTSGTVSITYSKAKEAEQDKEKAEDRMTMSPPPPVYSISADNRQQSVDSSLLREDEPALAYMTSEPEPQNVGSGFSSRYDDRRVQFGADQGSEGSHEPPRSVNAPPSIPPVQVGGGYTSSPGDLAQSRELPPTELQQSSPRHPALSSYRVPPPQLEEDSEDEHALNAAAAREVSRELDSLMFQAPVPPGVASSIHTSQIPPPQPQPQSQIQMNQPPQSTTPTPSHPPASTYSSPNRDEPQYIRERYRSPTLQSSHSRESGVIEDHPQSNPIGLGNTPSPALSYRTPDEYPQSTAPPRPFYSLPPASGSASSLPGADGPRKISAAAFRRARPQGLNSSSNLNSPVVPDGTAGGGGGGFGSGGGPGGDGRVSPLVINKRSSRNLGAGETPAGPRYSPEPDGVDYRRNVSSQYQQPPQQQYQQNDGRVSAAYDDTYDYISAYANNGGSH